MDREGITKSEIEIRERLRGSEEMVKEMKRQRDQEIDDGLSISLNDINYHNGKCEGLKLALAIVLSNKYSAELDNLRGE